MKAQITVRYYQLLLNNKKLDSGFTLIELLVVIMMIGILSLMGFNSFLNQAPKAKQSEAKTAIAAINSAQNTYRLEHHSFANNIDKLALGLPLTTTNYTYNVVGNDTLATVNAITTNTALKGYAGAVEKYAINSKVEISGIICEALAAGNNIAVVPVSGIPGTGACGIDKELGR